MLRKTILAALVAAFAPAAMAKEVFAHYMAANILESTAFTDVGEAAKLGVTAFALNFNFDALNSNWIESCTEHMFAAATENNFKIFFSMDLNGKGDATRDKFQSFVNSWMNHSAYYHYDKRPVLSTFSVGTTSAGSWPNFLGKLNSGNGVYFIPEPDNYNGYYAYNQPAGTKAFWDTWAPVVDGVFSWETAWTKDGKKEISITDWDQPHAKEANNRGLSYMVPMSSLQYKHWVVNGNNDNWYRVGENAVVKRMEQVLSMNPQPEFAEVITWNDSGESHYIGEVHTDGQLEPFKEYANEGTYSHKAWQPLYKSFIAAFKENVDAKGMRPQGTSDKYVGAIWYRNVLTTSTCRDKPSGAADAKDAVNWAVVVASGVTNAYVQVYSGGQKIAGPTKLAAGLNYGTATGMKAGKQYIEVFETDNVNGGSWNYKFTRTGVKDVVSNTNNGLCNYNYLVYGLKAGKGN